MKLEEGMYVRTKNGKIRKILSLSFDKNWKSVFTDTHNWLKEEHIAKASHNILDLIEYMDLLILEKPFKVYGSNEEFMLFNPVRCDGFTVFEDGTHCIILDLIFIVDVKELKIKGVLTHEQFDKNCYMIGGN